jgi:hypothetical protein
MIDAQRIAESVGLYWNGVWQVDETKFCKAVEIAYVSGLDDNGDEE